MTTERVDPATALWLGVKETWFVVDRTLVLYRRRSLPAARPPTSSAGRSGSPRFPARSRPSALPPLIHLAAVLSVSIGLLNLFPVPLLDGGHLLFYAVEAVRGRPLSERAQEMGFRIGLRWC